MPESDLNLADIYSTLHLKDEFIAGVEYEIDSVQSNFLLTLTEVSAVSGSSDYTYTRSLSKDGEIEMILNENPNLIKRYNANRFNTEIKPMKVDYATERHLSYLMGSNFEEVELQYDAAIQNDSTVSTDNPNGLNDEDTSPLWGKYLKIKLFFQKRTYQKLYDSFVHYVPSSRMFNK